MGREKMLTRVGSPQLNAINLKEILWEMLNDVRENKVAPANALAVAIQAREILRATRIQLSILNQKATVTNELMTFAKPK